MPDLLTPGEVVEGCSQIESGGGWYEDLPWDPERLAATLRAYAEVVEAVAATPPFVKISTGWDDWEYQCCHCEAVVNPPWLKVPDMADWKADHAPDCLYLRARKLRGKSLGGR